MIPKSTVALAATILLAAAAHGQVAPTQSGQALDANPQAGSLGYNPVNRPERIDSQLYVTGQVSGLAGFRGRQTIPAENEFRINVPSAALSDFRQRSVSIEDALRGGTYRTSPYFDPSRTVYGGGVVLEDRSPSIPGGTTTGTGTPGRMRQLYVDATRDYVGLMDYRRPGILAVGSEAYQEALSGPRFAGGVRDTDLPEPPRPARTSAVGLLDPERRAELAQGIHDLLRLDVLHDRSELARVRAGMDEMPAEDRVDELAPMQPGEEEPLAGDLPPRAVEPVPPEEPAAAPADVFMDVLTHMQQQRALEEAESGQAEAGLPLPPSEPLVITTLAGTGQDRFNRHMARASRMMRNGRYYDASDEYEYAAILNPSNPLAQAGQGLAYFGAGEPVTAAHRVMRALRLFPPLMETRIEVEALVGDKVYQQRLDELHEMLDTDFGSKQKTLLLLATFLHHNAGDRQQAEKWAEHLMALTLRDKLLNAYARYVLRGPDPEGAKSGQTSPR